MKILRSEETVLIMALPIESQRAFEKAGIEVHYCGIGKVNAAFKATELLMTRSVKQVLNLGTAGSHKFPTHSLIECVGFVQRDMDLSPLGFPRGETPQDPIAGKLLVEPISQRQKGICGTGDVFEISSPKLECDLVDMEAYAIAKVCKKLGIAFHSFKYITDGSDDNAHKDWIENLKPASEALLAIYQELVR
ncbi:MAG: 5-methylthioadenosine nucleosidase/S-adenosylhomocysteine nucleosidase [Pseudomonadota bacterium]|jgi:adenosylhomocysteine nucleosidase